MATGVRLIDDSEELTVSGQVDNAKWWIKYKRPPAHVRSHVQQKHTKRGDKTDWQKVTVDLGKTAIIEWGGFIDSAGAAIEYKPELVGALPVDIMEELSEALMGSVAGDAESAENLGDTSGSN